MNVQNQKPDILPIIEQHVSLERHGKEHVGLCPFHSEKTPSFTVSPAKQMYHCFGCGVGGDVIDFVRRLNGYEFKDACRHLSIDLDDNTKIKPSRRVKSRMEQRSKDRRRARQERIERQMQTWIWRYEAMISETLDLLENILPRIKPDELDAFAWLIGKRDIWRHHLTVIANGNEEDWHELWTEQARH